MVYDRGAFYVVNGDEKRDDYRNYQPSTHMALFAAVKAAVPQSPFDVEDVTRSPFFAP